MEAALFIALAEFITLERTCCPFFQFGLEVELGADSAWLQITGPEGVKPFLELEMGLSNGKS